MDVVKFCETLRDPKSKKLSDQLQDSATSAAANYMAACSARNHDEFVAKICIAAEESEEAAGWLQVLTDSGKSSGSELRRLTQEGTELMKILSKSKRTALRNQAARRAEKQRKK